MAEEFAKFKRFEYRTNSNLVLQREGAAPSQNEPTGEPESLRGRVYSKMGDLVQYEKPKELEELKEKKKRKLEEKRRGGDIVQKKAKMDILKGETVLSTDVTELQIYRPRSQVTKTVYEQLLSVLQQPLGDQTPDVLRGAADEVLAAIKTDGVLDTERKKDVEEVLGSISDEYFQELYRLAKQITDYGADVEDEEQDDTVRTKEGLDDAAGVAVVFDEDDDDEQEGNFLGEIGDDEDDDDDDEGGKMDDRDDRGIHVAAIEEDEEEEEEKKESKYVVDIQKIDAHWLQRELGKIFHDPNKCIATEKEILSILPIRDLQQCENRLVQVLQYENFEFTKLLLKNRLKLLYCTRLGQAQTEEEKAAVLEDMRQTPDAQPVLEELDRASKKRDRERDVTRDLRKEVRQLQLRRAGERDVDMDDEGIAARGTKGARVAEEQQKKPSHMLDLDSLAFQRGSHFMANTKCQLPQGSYRVQKRGYEEVHVKPFVAPEISAEDLVHLSKLPDWCKEAFPRATSLNPVQSKVFPTAFNEHSENLLVCAPTGSGKTNVAMLTILNVMSQFRLKDGSFDLAGFKIVYVAPMKALVQEVVQSFSLRLQSYGVTIRELSGDVNLTKAQIDETQIIVTTPEKWDIITRKAGDQRAYTQLVRLIIIDEIHLLHDKRGPVLEAIVARTIRQIETTQEHIRLVGLSATLPNYEDVAIFLRVNPDKGLFFFGNQYRPVPLEQSYVGVTDKKAIKRFNTMNEVCYEKLMESAGKNQVLIFVHSRKETTKTASTLRDLAMQNDTLAKFLHEDSASREILQAEVESIKTQEVKDLLPYGFAIHHAGLPRTDRKLIEDLFADKHIQVLVSTSTLAWGVNLPAHTVIIKGTQVYNPEKGMWDELSPMDMMQMVGRAGRPQYDKTGHGIVITQHSELQYYLSLNNQQLPIESQLLSTLPDLLNAELVLGTIQTRQDAVNWLGYTYLYVRMMRAPRLYGISPDEAEEDKLLEQRRVDLVHSALMLLDKHNLIKYDKRTGSVQVTALGRVASHYYIKHPSIATFNDHLKPMMSDIELLRLFSLSNEFKYIPLREEEKVELAKLVERVPVPVKGGTDEASSKVNVLLQAYVSKLKLDGFALLSDMVYVQQSAGRIMRAIFEICLRRGWAALALRALNWCKMIDKRMWASQTPLRHFKGLNEDVLRKVEKKDFAWERYYDLSSNEIGELIRFPKMGRTIHKLVHQFPKLDLSAYVQPITRSCLMVELTITPDFQWDQRVHGRAEPFWVFVEDVNGEQILHQEMFVLKERRAEEEHTLNFTVPITEPLPPQYFIRVVSDRWINAQTLLPVSFRHLILPEKYPPHTELLDLQPLPLTALRYPEAEKLYAAQRLKVFNPIQTQTFSTLYSTNDNCLICAPAASGKIVCAEFAVLRMLANESDPVKRCVYVVPNPATAKERFNEWSVKFGKALGFKVAELVGESTSDVKILEESNVVITTPEKWDLMSRRWKTRKSVQEVRLFVVDELHLLDSDVGPTLEAVVSRMRYISAQVEKPIRVVAMAASLANAKDVGEWIGAGSAGLFNFSPNVRTVPLEMVIQGFDIHHRATRLLAMSRPVYQSIKHYSPDKPVIVFVPDRKQARMTAIDLLLHAASDDKPKRFLHVGDEVMRPHLAAARERSLRQTLEYGVGFLHEGFSTTERAVIERLFESGAIQVIVATEQLCWGMTMLAHLVIVMDTKKFDGHENRYVDYPIHDVLQMMGRASRPGIDQSGMCVLLTQNSKKEYYKKFIYEPLPVESHLDQRMADHMNAEIVMKTIENKQDALDWLTWTFYYRRLSQNPNYYGLQGVTHQHLSDHLSEVVENTVEGLERFGCCSIEDDVELAPANLGLIAAFYYTRHTTIETFSRCVNEETKRRGLLDILCAASEFDSVPVRSEEEATLRGLAQSLGIKVEKEKLNDPHTKAQLLLSAHFNRTPITTDLASDQRFILEHAVRLLQGLVDVISSCGWLTPALFAMELSQMIVQATSSNASPLMQLPHFTQQVVDKAKKMKVEDVIDLMNMEDDTRNKLLSSLSQAQLMDVARACNRFPCISLEYKVHNPDDLKAGASARIVVRLARDTMEDDASLGPVYAPFYPKEKEESWWLVVGGPQNTLVAIKRTTIAKAQVNVKLDVELGEEAGTFDYTLYLMSDSYQGCDQEYSFKLNVKA